MCCGAPIGFGVVFIALEEPGRDLLLECRDIGDAAVEALPRQDGQLGFRHVEPASMLWRVMPLEAFGDPWCFGGWESLIERSRGMGVEVVLNQNDGVCAGNMKIAQLLEHMGVIDGCAARGGLEYGANLRAGRTA